MSSAIAMDMDMASQAQIAAPMSIRSASDEPIKSVNRSSIGSVSQSRMNAAVTAMNSDASIPIVEQTTKTKKPLTLLTQSKKL
jgi:hypothetical protein